jgi:acetoin utilization deacetylase AcuC-like enzyme
MTELICVLGTGHAAHNPPFQVVDGVRTGVLDTPDRVGALLTGALAAGAAVVSPDPVTATDLVTVHDGAMVEFLRTAWSRWLAEGLEPPVFPVCAGPRQRVRRPDPRMTVRALAAYYCRDTCSPLTAATWDAALESAASAITAARLIRGGKRAVYALCRPPGHHAARAEFSGFCYLNNAALAARALQTLGRVAVVDLDFHHGNGTQDVFWNDPDVLYASVHGDPRRYFPFFSGFAEETGGPRARGLTLNVPLPDGTDGRGYLRAVTTILHRVSRFSPDAVVVSLGLDIADTDPVGTFAVDQTSLLAAGELLAGLGKPLLVVQEGGYDLAELGKQVAAFLTGITAVH